MFFKESGLASLQDHDRKLLCGRLARGFVSSVVAGEDSWSPPGSFFDPLGSSGAPLGLHASVSCVIAGEDSWNPLGPHSGPPPVTPPFPDRIAFHRILPQGLRISGA